MYFFFELLKYHIRIAEQKYTLTSFGSSGCHMFYYPEIYGNLHTFRCAEGGSNFLKTFSQPHFLTHSLKAASQQTSMYQCVPGGERHCLIVTSTKSPSTSWKSPQ